MAITQCMGNQSAQGNDVVGEAAPVVGLADSLLCEIGLDGGVGKADAEIRRRLTGQIGYSVYPVEDVVADNLLEVG